MGKKILKVMLVMAVLGIALRAFNEMKYRKRSIMPGVQESRGKLEKFIMGG